MYIIFDCNSNDDNGGSADYVAYFRECFVSYIAK